MMPIGRRDYMKLRTAVLLYLVVGVLVAAGGPGVWTGQAKAAEPAAHATEAAGTPDAMSWWIGAQGYATLAEALSAAVQGNTIDAVCADPTPIPGGGTASVSNLTIELNGCTAGPGSPFLTVNSNDVMVMGPGVIDGWTGSANSPDPGIKILSGDNFTLYSVEVRRWADGVELAGSVASFKIGENWIHSNTDAGLQVDGGVTLSGNVTIEGNLFKNNGGNGIQHDGIGTLPAEYNSWGDLHGPNSVTGGDGIGGSVAADPFTYAELFMDVEPNTMGVERPVLADVPFNVTLSADAVRLWGLAFKITFDPDVLTLNLVTLSSPWDAACSGSAGEGSVEYFCALYPPYTEWTETAGTIAYFNFTANVLPDQNPLTTYLDISHLEKDTNASAIGGQKVFVDNAGYNAPSAPQRDITDTDDGRIIVIDREVMSRCEPEHSFVPWTEQATVCIYVQDAVGLFGADFEMSFPGMVGMATVVDENGSVPGVQILRNYTWVPSGWREWTNTANNSTGYLHYMVFGMSGTPAVQNSGPVACMHFQATAPGQFDMAFTRHDLSTRDGVLLPNTVHSCSVTFYDPTAVTISRFLARPVLDAIRVKWETAQEIDNLGFNLYRSTTRLGDKTKLNAELIPSKVPPGSPFGARYTWTDRTVVPGQGYFYWLEDVGVSGETTMHGPAKTRANP
jgi:hypothetical protein